MIKVNRTTIPSYWGWLKDAEYAGTRLIWLTVLDVWKYNVSCAIIKVYNS